MPSSGTSKRKSNSTSGPSKKVKRAVSSVGKENAAQPNQYHGLSSKEGVSFTVLFFPHRAFTMRQGYPPRAGVDVSAFMSTLLKAAPKPDTQESSMPNGSPNLCSQWPVFFSLLLIVFSQALALKAVSVTLPPNLPQFHTIFRVSISSSWAELGWTWFCWGVQHW